MDWLADAFRLLADPTRLRLLRLVARQELNAGELTAIVGAGQSTVSRHLALLAEAGLVRTRQQGRFVWYSIDPEALREGGTWAPLVARLDVSDDPHGDLVRLATVLRRREESAGRPGEGAAKAPFVPGRSWAAWAQALGWLVPPGLRAADLGCGDGALTLEIARFAHEVVGVDRNEALLARARAAAARRRAANVRFVRGDLTALDLPAGSFDLAVLSQTLHCLEEPGRALAETARILAPGARVLVLDLLPHREEWVREKLGHARLGFAAEELSALLRQAGFASVEVERVPPAPRERFRVVLAIGRRGVKVQARRRASK